MSEKQNNITSEYKAMGEETISLLSNLPFSKLIGDPLKACIQAQNESSLATLNYIKEIGLATDTKTKKNTVVKVEFEFVQNGKINKISVPLLTLVPIPYIAIQSVKIEFKAKLTASSGTPQMNAEKEVQKSKEQVKQENEKSEKESTKEKLATADAEADKLLKETEALKKDVEEKNGEEKKAAEKKLAASSEELKNAEEKKSTLASFLDGFDVEKSVSALSDIVGAFKNKDGDKGAEYSSKKDSAGTRESNYSIETTVDFTVLAGPSDMPGGLSKLLEVLNGSVDVYDPEGELSVSEQNVKVGEKIIATYKNTNGVFAPSVIKITPSAQGQVSDNNMLFTFSKEGKYTITAEKKKLEVTVVNS